MLRDTISKLWTLIAGRTIINSTAIKSRIVKAPYSTLIGTKNQKVKISLVLVQEVCSWLPASAYLPCSLSASFDMLIAHTPITKQSINETFVQLYVPAGRCL